LPIVPSTTKQTIQRYHPTDDDPDTMMLVPSKISFLCLLASMIVSSTFVGGEGSGDGALLRGGGDPAAGGLTNPQQNEEAFDHDEMDRRILDKKVKEASSRGGISSDTTGGDATTTIDGVSLSSSSFDRGCIPTDNRTYNLTTDEANNGRWMNQARTSRRRRAMGYAADLVVEAQRWAKYLAGRKIIRTRDYLNRNLFCGASEEIGEYVISSRSVNKTGAFASMMNGGGRAYILYAPYDRFGIGIARNGTLYYMVTLFRNRA
jgi:Cysteine-rich secretory protein family